MVAFFSYKAIDASGQSVSGSIEAADRRQALNRLTKQRLRPVSIALRDHDEIDSGQDETVDFYTWEKVRIRTGKPASVGMFQSSSALALSFFKKLLELLSSGLPLGDAIKLMSARLNDPVLKGLANTLWKKLSEGRTLATAMADHPKVFNHSMIHLVEAGEESGNLVPIIRRIVEHMEDAARLRSKILSSLAYPIFICIVAFFVVVFLIFFLLPKIRMMLDTVGGEMSFFAKVLIGGSDLLLQYGPFMVIGIGILVFSLTQWRKKAQGRDITDFWLLHTPLLNRVVLYNEVFQISSLMATLMSSGVNTTETLRLVERTIKNTQIRQKFTHCRQQIQEGVSIALSFSRTHLFPNLAIDILAVGENTGNIVHSLEEITRIYQNEISRILRFMTTLVTTGALFMAFGVVVFIALAVILSLLGMSSSFMQ